MPEKYSIFIFKSVLSKYFCDFEGLFYSYVSTVDGAPHPPCNIWSLPSEQFNVAATFPQHLVKVWKTFANYFASTVSSERCHNVELWKKKLWKCCLLTLLQHNPGTLLKCWATVVKMFPPDVALTSYSKVANTSSQRWGKVVKTLAHEVAATYFRKVSRVLIQCCRKTLYENISTILWQHSSAT